AERSTAPRAGREDRPPRRFVRGRVAELREVRPVELQVERSTTVTPGRYDVRRPGEVARVGGQLLSHQAPRRTGAQAERTPDPHARLVGVTVGERLARLAVQVPRLVR